ncbi:MAG TPA: diguanylate cyclase [Myxococcales bacterium]|nr:diguanylate cyclase [Myxococcales bacterium]
MIADFARQKAFDSLLIENDALRHEIESLRASQELAYRDPLTGLWNRRFLEDRVEEEMSRAERNPRRGFSVVLARPEGLYAGDRDRTLLWCANFLADAMPAHEPCCRIGPDTFALILPEAGAEACVSVVGRLRRRLLRAQDHELATDLSFGAATWSPDTTLADLLELAERRARSGERWLPARPARLMLVAP